MARRNEVLGAAFIALLAAVCIFANPTSSFWNPVVYSFKLLVIILLSGIIALFLYQNKLIYVNTVPGQSSNQCKDNPKNYQNPSERGIPYDDLSIITQDNIRLNAWFLRRPNVDKVPTVIYFHENTRSIYFFIYMGHTLDVLSLLYHCLKINVLTVDYRGYGSSTGFPSEHGLGIDAEAAVKYCLNCPLVDQSKLIIFGKALGGSVAIHSMVKYQENIQGLILEDPFTSVDDLVEEQYPWLSYVKNVILRNHWPNLDRIQLIDRPIIIIKDANSAKKAHGNKLFEAAKKASYKEICDVANDYPECCIEKVGQFMTKVLE